MMFKRKPDFVIGGDADPYLHRWYLIPRNRWLNLYLHHFMRSDDDRAMHDHPWWWMSVILAGPGYYEHTPTGIFWRKPWRPRFGKATALHRVELSHIGQPYHPYDWPETPVWTLFLTGPRVREWGFQCPKGWTHWRIFCGLPAGQNGGAKGPGCDV